MEDIHQFACFAQKNQLLFSRFSEICKTVGSPVKFHKTTLVSNDDITIFAYDDLKLGQIIKDLGLLKLILKALKWDFSGNNLVMQLDRLKNSNFHEILSNPDLLQDEDLMQLLGPYTGRERQSSLVITRMPQNVPDHEDNTVTEMEVGVDPDLFFPYDDDETRSAEECNPVAIQHSSQMSKPPTITSPKSGKATAPAKASSKATSKASTTLLKQTTKKAILKKVGKDEIKPCICLDCAHIFCSQNELEKHIKLKHTPIENCKQANCAPIKLPSSTVLTPYTDSTQNVTLATNKKTDKTKQIPIKTYTNRKRTNKGKTVTTASATVTSSSPILSSSPTEVNTSASSPNSTVVSATTISPSISVPKDQGTSVTLVDKCAIPNANEIPAISIDNIQSTKVEKCPTPPKMKKIETVITSSPNINETTISVPVTSTPITAVIAPSDDIATTNKSAKISSAKNDKDSKSNTNSNKLSKKPELRKKRVSVRRKVATTIKKTLVEPVIATTEKEPPTKTRSKAVATRFECTDCGKKLSTKGNLKAHKETHTKQTEESFPCDKCEKV